MGSHGLKKGFNVRKRTRKGAHGQVERRGEFLLKSLSSICGRRGFPLRKAREETSTRRNLIAEHDTSDTGILFRS